MSVWERAITFAFLAFAFDPFRVHGEASFGILRGTITDDYSGAPTPCTVSITDSQGHVVAESQSFTSGFRCDGLFTKKLPAGPTLVRVTRGFEIRAIEREVVIPPDSSVEMNFSLERTVDLRKLGWYAGDSHVHMIHGENTMPVDFDYVALTARAEDLQYLSLAQAWTMDNPTPEKLTAELAKRSRPDSILTWNLEAPKNYYRGDAGRCLGHCWMLGVHGRTPDGHDVLEALLNASAHDYQSDKPTYANFESHQLIHAQGGAVFYTHPARWWLGPWGGRGGYPKLDQMRVSNMAVELPLDTLIGPSFDGLDVITGSGEFEANAMAFELWCLLLNHGYRVAATASSDSCFDRIGGATPGVVRTYTYIGKDFSFAKLTQAAARGRNFATSGPLLLVTMDGEPPGTDFAANGKLRQMQIQAWASGADSKGLTRLEILRNGRTVNASDFHPSCSSFTTNLTVAEMEDAWYCVRLYGSDPERQRAISGAFFFDSKGHRIPTPVPTQIKLAIQDSASGAKLSGSITEISFQGTLPIPGRKHRVGIAGSSLTVPATVRLRAQVKGYDSKILSPILDNSDLVQFITHLSAEDLLKWDTYERIRDMLSHTELTFSLDKKAN